MPLPENNQTRASLSPIESNDPQGHCAVGAGSAIAATRWHSFFKGWQDACACKPQRPEYSNNTNDTVRESYEHGYEAGVGDRRKTQYWATLQFGYSPTILRAASSPNVRSQPHAEDKA